MRLKKFALRGFLVLAVGIALCILFSGTIRTLTTPKVRFAPVKMGQFEQVTELSGKVVFPEKEEIAVSVPEGLTLTVTRVFAEPGKRLKKRDKLLSAVVTDAEKTLASLQTQADTSRETLASWERKNGSIRLSRNEQRWVDAWQKARDAEKTERAARLDLLTELEALGLKTVPEALPENADEKTAEAWKTWQEAKQAMDQACQDQADLDRYAVEDSVWTLMKQKQEEERKLADTEDQIMQIMLLSRRVETITAPHSGYVVSVEVEKDATVSGDRVLVYITPEGVSPVIRAELQDAKMSVQKGTVLSVDSESWGTVETKVTDTGVTETGHPYADAEISEDVIYGLGDVKTLIGKDEIRLKMTSRAKESTCLVPASAVRGSGDGRYVYIGETENSALAGTRIVVQKMDVTVLAENASVVSVSEDLARSKVIYMEDRMISEGGTVMLYEE